MKKMSAVAPGDYEMFGNQNQPQVVQRRRSFLSTVALGLSGVIVTTLLCVTTIVLYGASIIDAKTGNIFEFAEAVVQGLPELAESLPPAIADVLNDRRQPDYADQLDVSVSLADDTHRRGIRPVVVVRNKGDEVVSLLSMRIVVMNEDGEPLSELNEWAATPFAADHDWRGPLLPGAQRRFATNHRFVGKSLSADHLEVDYEITDIRVWEGNETRPTTLTSVR